MKLKNKDLAVLEQYGFSKINKEAAKADCDFVTARYEYEYNLGYSRRGQYYSVFVAEDGRFDIYASNPDGDGAPVAFDDLFIKLIKDGIV